MYQKLEASNGNLLGCLMSRRVTRDDFTTLNTHVEEALSQWENIRLLLELRELQGVQPCAVVEELKLNLKNGSAIERMAVVGDCRQEKSWARNGVTFVRTKLRFFEVGERDDAWQWVQEN